MTQQSSILDEVKSNAASDGSAKLTRQPGRNA